MPCSFPSSFSRAKPIALSATPSTTPVNNILLIWLLIGATLLSTSLETVFFAGKSSNRKAWDWVDDIPIPSHSTVILHPVDPSQGSSLCCRKKSSGSSEPSTFAVVIMKSACPDPDPKCLSPVIRKWSFSGVAIDRVFKISPPEPGSEVTVPHQWSCALSMTHWR